MARHWTGASPYDDAMNNTIEERLNVNRNRMTMARKRVAAHKPGVGGATMEFTAAAPRMGPFVRTPRWHPARWFGYTWRRADNDPVNVGGGFHHWQYWTDKQLAHRAFRLACEYPEAHTNEHYRE